MFKASRSSIDRQIVLRTADLSDSRLLWLWTNDAKTRSASLYTEPISWLQHLRWFRAALGETRQRIFVAHLPGLAGEFVGVVRCEVHGQDPIGEVSLNLAPTMRGFGWGHSILSASCSRFLRELPIERLRAQIKSNNGASAGVFRGAGFAPQQKHTPMSSPAVEVWIFDPHVHRRPNLAIYSD